MIVQFNDLHGYTDFDDLILGIKEYLHLGIKPSKLVLGVPWYGYSYSCINYSVSWLYHDYLQLSYSNNSITLFLQMNDVCSIKQVPFRGVSCSDAAGSQVNYGSIELHLLPYSISGLLWDDDAKSPYFTYKVRSRCRCLKDGCYSSKSLTGFIRKTKASLVRRRAQFRVEVRGSRSTRFAGGGHVERRRT